MRPHPLLLAILFVGFSISIQAIVYPPTGVGISAGRHVLEGTHVTIVGSATAQDPTTLNYQWYHNGEKIPHASETHLVLDPVRVADEGEYFIEASNSAGSVRSNTIRIDVTPATPVEIPILEDQALSYGSYFVINVSSYPGSDPKTIRWYRNGEVLEVYGNLEIEQPMPSDAGTYRLEITNVLGTVVSNDFTLSVPEPAPVTLGYHQSDSRSLEYGADASWLFTFEGTPNVSLEIFHNGERIRQYETYNRYQFYLSKITLEDAGSYELRASNAYGQIEPVLFSLEVANPIAPTASWNISPVALPDSAWLNFGVTTTGDGPLNYVLYQNGVKIRETSGIHDPLSEIGSGTFDAEVTGPGGTAHAPPLVISLLHPQPPLITKQPASHIFSSNGFGNSLQVSVHSTAPVTYQWYRNGEAIPSEIRDALYLTPASPLLPGDFHVEVTNSEGTATSSVASARLSEVSESTLYFRIQPPPEIRYDGSSTLVLSASPQGNFPMTYQWYRDGEPLSGATNTSLHISPLSAPLGTYTLQATNDQGTITSNACNILQLPDPMLPQVLEHPESISVYESDPFSLSVVATGTGIMTYQWLHNNTPIAGATSPTLEISSAKIGESGSYVVQYSDDVARSTSHVAQVEVIKPISPTISIQPQSGFYAVGSSPRLTVTASALPEPHYQWRFNGTPIPNANSSTLDLLAFDSKQAGNYSVIVSNRFGQVDSHTAYLSALPHEGQAVVLHQSFSVPTETGTQVTVQNHVNYAGELARLTWQVLLPQGWSVVSTSTEVAAHNQPDAGTTDLAEWSWSPVPDSPFGFQYTLYSETAESRATISALVESLVDSSTLSVLATPDPLPIGPAPTVHAGDTDADHRINLTELLRVIELYNTRLGSTRTGRYRLNIDTVDGYESDAQTPSTGPAFLERFHSADTDRNGHFSLQELLRVIELYNFRSGTTRTGAYHRATDTIDGFAPGSGE